MSTKAGDSLIRRVEQGARVRQVREALGMTGDEFAAELTKWSRLFGVGTGYEKGKVSKIESGSRKLTIEEAAIISAIDRDERGAAWLIFGDVSKRAARDLFSRVAGSKGG